MGRANPLSTQEFRFPLYRLNACCVIREEAFAGRPAAGALRADNSDYAVDVIALILRMGGRSVFAA
jgi:hypothetical protein